jgi:hypothetical protein
MYRITLLRCTARKKVFELYCREQLLCNFSLRELTPAERRVEMTKTFKQLSVDALQGLKTRASLEEARLEKLHRAAASFKPITPYEFFVKEQHSNPALGSATSPREREVKLLQIYQTLPDNAKEALMARAERYNAEHSKLPTAPALPVVKMLKKKEVPVKSSTSTKAKTAKKKKNKEKTTNKSKKKSMKALQLKREQDAKKAKAKSTKARGAVSPYTIFVKEQMASVHHLAPKERMRVIAERWRSLTNEERERRLQAARVQIAAETAAKTEAYGIAAPAAAMAPPQAERAADWSFSSGAATTPPTLTAARSVSKDEGTEHASSPASSSAPSGESKGSTSASLPQAAASRNPSSSFAPPT